MKYPSNNICLTNNIDAFVIYIDIYFLCRISSVVMPTQFRCCSAAVPLLFRVAMLCRHLVDLTQVVYDVATFRSLPARDAPPEATNPTLLLQNSADSALRPVTS